MQSGERERERERERTAFVKTSAVEKRGAALLRPRVLGTTADEEREREERSAKSEERKIQLLSYLVYF
jgi:hypothetical protein